jgi:hypothetical protein
MATITPGTGSTINATTIEGQLWQLIHLYQNAERVDTSSTNRIESSKDDTFNMSGTFKLPGQLTFNSTSGIFTEAAIPYLPATPFLPGSPLGTIKATTLSQYFIDVIMYLITWQNNGLKNTQGLKNIACKFDYNTMEFSGTFNLPYVVTIGAGGITSESAVEWLLT